MKNSLVIFLSLFFLQTGCRAQEVSFEKGKLSLGTKILNIEIAKTSEQQQQGLMFRKKLDKDSGMIFIYNSEQRLSFWMKNTFIPLSIGFFNKNQELIDIQDMAPVTSEMQRTLPSYHSVQPAMYALEVNQGWFAKNNIKLKSKFKFLK
ncbi:MAG: DUF192 domain-containing protein [Bdellovibrionales bacterium]|nr:DUF192 domain-containing protein [Bdellovibrionales bacterium]